MLTSRNFYVYVTGIILLLAALAGSLIMYCAARKNTANAQACLEPIRKLLSEKEPDVGKLEEYFKLTEKYFHRFGVLPSVRSEFAGNKEKDVFCITFFILTLTVDRDLSKSRNAMIR